MSTPTDVVDQTTYTQPQLPGIDWSRYETREVPTDDQIIDALPSDEFYEHFAQVLFLQYDVVVTAGQLKVATAFANKSLAYDQLRQAQAAHPSNG